MPPSSTQYMNRFQGAPGAGAGPFPTDMGFEAWTGDPGACVAGTAGGTAGTLQLRRFSIPGPLVVSAVLLDITTSGNTLTANQCFAGLWDSTGALVGLSASQHVAFASIGLIACNLAAGAGMPPGPFVVDTPYVYVGWWFNGTTGPFLARTLNADDGVMNGPSTVPVAQARTVTANTGLTNLASTPLALGTLSKGTNPFWCALA